MMLVLCLFLLLGTLPVTSKINIISTSDGELGKKKCAIMCSGVNGADSWGNDGWYDAGTAYKSEAYRDIYYTECGFTRAPTVTVTLQGEDSCPSVYLIHANKNWARVVVVENVLASDLENCNVNWIAIGYKC